MVEAGVGELVLAVVIEEASLQEAAEVGHLLVGMEAGLRCQLAALTELQHGEVREVSLPL